MSSDDRHSKTLLKRANSDAEQQEMSKKLRVSQLLSQDPSSNSESEFRLPKLSDEDINDHLHFLTQNYSQLSDDAYDPTSILRMLLKRINRLSPGICVHADHADRLFEESEELRKALERRDFRAVLYTEALYTPVKPTSGSDKFLPLSRREKEAIVTSWTLPYQGSADALEAAMIQYMTDDATGGRRYARYAPFTQSSGTGKSRMNDELAKKILYIPINLGKPDSYPPVDTKVRAWFERIRTREDKQWGPDVQVFMCALFETARARLDEIVDEFSRVGVSPEAITPSDLAKAFREKMNAGMQFEQHGKYRQEFYDAVCARADELKPYTIKVPAQQGGSPTLTANFQLPSDGSGESEVMNMLTAAKALIHRVNPSWHTSYPERPLVVLCFDEAQMLTDQSGSSAHTLFVDVRRALRNIRSLPIFSLFLSTVGKLEQFSPLPQLEVSTRLRRDLRPFEPIVWTPLDVLAQRIGKNSRFTLTRVASTHHMAHLGRPLFPAMYDSSKDLEFRRDIVTFAGMKLLYAKRAIPDDLTDDQSLACIAVRIPIEFGRTDVAIQQATEAEETEKVEGAERERKLVSHHMRLLLYAGTGFSPIITVSSSEPLLAEAAYTAMVRLRWQGGKFKEKKSEGDRMALDPYAKLCYHLGHSFLDLGPRGEIVAAILLLDARDCATTFPLADHEPPPGCPKDFEPDPAKFLHSDGAWRRRIITVMQFLEALLGTANLESCADSLPRAFCEMGHAKIPLATAFADAFIYFNHFIKAQSSEVVNQEYLLLAISRGAAIVCADNQAGIDLIIPVLFGTVLVKEKVSAIMIQVKNSRSHTTTVVYSLFTGINPYRCGVFDKNVRKPPSVLRLVFALASEESKVLVPLPPVRRSDRLEKPTARFTAYDIWCAGASHETFSVIQKHEEEQFATMLKTIRGPREVCPLHNEVIQRVLRQMQPLVSTDADHFSQWADLMDNMQNEYPLADDEVQDAE